MVLYAVAMETVGINFTFPVAECDLNLETKDKGLIASVSFGGIICSSYLWGYLADTKGLLKIQ